MSWNGSEREIAGRRRAPALDVVIAGGGMIGASAALALARAGFATALVEARAPVSWQIESEVDLRVVGLAPSSIELLADLGVWAAIRESRSSPYRYMHVWDSRSGAVIDFDAASEHRESLGHIVENALVQHTLWQALAAAGVSVHCPAEVTRFDARADRVEVQLAGGESLISRLLVAADGGASPLRAMAGIATRDRDYAQRAVVAHVSTERSHESTAWQRFLPDGPVALLPLADGRSSIVWSMPNAQAEQVLALDDAAFCDALGVASDFRLGRITRTTERASFPLRLRLARSYQSARLLLLGDAAHTVHPLAGQGANLGLRDVAELRDTLVRARGQGRDIGAPDVLRRYARRRRSSDALDALGFDALARIYAWQSPPLVAARGLGIGLLNRVSPLKRLIGRHAAGV